MAANAPQTTDAFISYRRDGGAPWAHLFYEHLKQRKFSLFYDIEAMSSGRFDETLYRRIEQAKYFLLVLSPGCMDRCHSQDDWVRREILHAQQKEKTIIPLFLPGFGWPVQMPEELSFLPKCHGVTIESMDVFDAKIDKIASLMRPAPPPTADSSSWGGGMRKISDRPSLISNVCSIGANASDGLFPNGTYSPVIHIDRCTVVRFIVSLVHPFGKAHKATTTLRIYNDRGALVFENVDTLEFASTYDRYSTGWIIRSDDGSFQQPGEYKAELSLDDSMVYTYPFRLVSESGYTPTGNQSTPSDLKQKEQKIRDLENRLSRPRGLLWCVLVLVCYVLMGNGIAYVPYYETFTVFLLLLPLLGAIVALIRYCNRHLFKSWIVSAFAAIFGFFILFVYLLIGTASCNKHKAEWQAELQRLKS